MAKKINPIYIGLHFGLGGGKEIKVTESSTIESVQILESNFPDIYISVEDAVASDFLPDGHIEGLKEADTTTESLPKEIIEEIPSTRPTDGEEIQENQEQGNSIDADGLPENPQTQKRKTTNR